MGREQNNLLKFFPHAYSVRRLAGGSDDKGKTKASYNTIRQPLSDSLFFEHFEGKAAVSVQPILEEGNICQWGAIDIDDYNDPKLIDRVRHAVSLFNLPCYVERSKSGGVHIYFFLNQAVVAKPFRRALQKIAVWLGFPKYEIRPLQDEIDFSASDLGTFMVLPGFGMGYENFKLAYNSCLVDIKEFNKITDEGDFNDGPACLYPLQRIGQTSGEFNNRNLLLYQLGVFFRYKFPADWAKRLTDYNSNIITPSLPGKEVAALIKQLEKNSKCHYRCSGEPFEDVCNKSACQFRKYGVAARESAESIISPEGITILDTDPPVFFVTLNNPLTAETVRIKLSSDQLLNVNNFKKRCLETIHIIPTLPKQKEWEAVVSTMLSSAQHLPVSFDMTEEARVLDAVYRYCLTTVKSSNAEDILRGRVWMEQQDDKLVAHFRQVDFTNYLATHRIGLKSNEVHSTLMELVRMSHLQTEKIDLGGATVAVFKTVIHSRYLQLQTELEQEKNKEAS